MFSIKELLDNYFLLFPNERDSLTLLQEQVLQGDSIFSRKNFNGHITASAFVYNPKKKKILLVYHKALQKWLQPGWHIEDIDNWNLVSAALREVKEETGLKNIDIFMMEDRKPALIDIDSHWIPENIKKNEPWHYHHDFRFLFYTLDDIQTLSEDDWVEKIEWFDVDYLNVSGSQKNISLKIHTFLDQKNFLVDSFFRSISSIDEKDINNFSFIIISHIIPSSVSFILFLHNQWLLGGVFAKPNSIHQPTFLFLQKKGIKLFIASRDDSFWEKVKQCIYESHKNKIILIDIGWYFSHIQKVLFNTCWDIIVWIVEDTENWYQKYVNNTFFPVYSLARSLLKKNEDYFVGHSIAYSVETLLKEKNVLPGEGKYGVIGFWKVGSWIADRLSLFSKNVAICEKNPLRKLQAHRLGYNVVPFDTIIKSVDVLFCATWSKIFCLPDFYKLKSNIIIATATSSDDEFDTNFLLSSFSKKLSDELTSSYEYTSSMNRFILLNDGRAVNFLHNAIVWKYIHLVQAWLFLAWIKLLNWVKDRTSDIMYLEEDDEYKIANLWLDFFW